MRSTWEPAFGRPTKPQRLIRLMLRRCWLTDTRDPDYSIGRLMTGYCSPHEGAPALAGRVDRAR
jgi:hypothetical protein